MSKQEKLIEEAYKALLLAKAHESKVADQQSEKNELYNPYTRHMIVVAMSYLDQLILNPEELKPMAIKYGEDELHVSCGDEIRKVFVCRHGDKYKHDIYQFSLPEPINVKPKI